MSLFRRAAKKVTRLTDNSLLSIAL